MRLGSETPEDHNETLRCVVCVDLFMHNDMGMCAHMSAYILLTKPVAPGT